MKDNSSGTVANALAQPAILAAAPASGRPISSPDVEWESANSIVVVVEAATEETARQHFLAIQAGTKTPLFELSRGLFFAQASETGRYWKFSMAMPS